MSSHMQNTDRPHYPKKYRGRGLDPALRDAMSANTTNDTEPETLQAFARTLPVQLYGGLRIPRPQTPCNLPRERELFMLTELWAASLAEWICNFTRRPESPGRE